MPWKEPAERHSDDLIAAIGQAAHHIATAITQGFQHMADAQTAALADLSTAISNIADAIAAEIQALQNAINAGAAQQPDDSAAIENQVAKLNQLTAALKAPLTAVVPPPSSHADPHPGQPAPGHLGALTFTPPAFGTARRSRYRSACDSAGILAA